jgi:integrase
VKIYRVENKGSIKYSVSHYLNGKRKQRMFAEFDAAHEAAKSIAKSLSKGELDVLELRSGDRLAYVHAIDALKPTGVALELAAKEYAEACKLLGGRAFLLEAAREYAKRQLHLMPNKSVPEAVEAMLVAKEKEGTNKPYMKVLKVYLRQFAKSVQCPVRSLTTSETADYLRYLPVSARSKNNARATLGAFFRFCKERGWLPKDHEGIEYLPKFKEPAKDIAIFTPAEMAQLLTHARPEMIPFLAIGAFAGLRSAEIGKLDWSEVHIADRFIEVKAAKAKTASRRIVPMSENLARWLAPHAQPDGKVVPFTNLSKQIGWLVRDINAELKEQKAKLVVWKKNALRHSFITYRVADIQNAHQVALEAGNSPQMIFKHYREVVRPAEAKKWF